jgi:hypothetical protein
MNEYKGQRTEIRSQSLPAPKPLRQAGLPAEDISAKW